MVLVYRESMLQSFGGGSVKERRKSDVVMVFARTSRAYHCYYYNPRDTTKSTLGTVGDVRFFRFCMLFSGQSRKTGQRQRQALPLKGRKAVSGYYAPVSSYLQTSSSSRYSRR